MARLFNIFYLFLFAQMGLLIGFPFPIQAQPADAKWQLVWADEFTGDKIDLKKWSFEDDCWGGGNEERQCYTNKEENASVEQGRLRITALKKRTRGFANTRTARHGETALQPGTKRYQKVKRRYSSARLTSKAKGDWQYGRFEARIKLPTGQGVWPAFWMLPSSSHYGPWAASGEIDIMEAVNLGMRCAKCSHGVEDRIYGTLHYGGVWPDNEHSGENIHLPTATDQFHTYAVEWSAGRIDWYVDDIHYATQTSKDWHTASGGAAHHAPFDRPFHIILNLAIGGKWPESQNNVGFLTADFPKHMLVDWVRVYQCIGDRETGKACLTKPRGPTG